MNDTLASHWRLASGDALARASIRALSASLGLGGRCLCSDPAPATSLDLSTDGAVLFDAARCVVFVSPKAADSVGRTQREMLGRRCSELYGCAACTYACPSVDRPLDATVRALGATEGGLVKRCTALRSLDGAFAGALETLHSRGTLSGARTVTRAIEPCLSASVARIVGSSPSMLELRGQVQVLARSEVTVLVTGETGTGKELVARALHEAGPRGQKPFHAVNCAAIGEHLLESELFGHERGAFTGATRQKLGRLELAADGTLFLDEIGCLPSSLQAKLLRALEAREFERVGGTRTLPLRARIVAATNLDLNEAVARGAFREDLLYRLRVVPLEIPPLRTRREDIEPIARSLLARLDPPGGLQITEDAVAALVRQDWPGNVRQLWNALQYAAALRSRDVLDVGALPPELRPASGPPSDERATIEHALAQERYSREAAARRLGVSRTTLWRRMKSLGLA